MTDTMQTAPFTITQLDNGLRIVIEHMPEVKTTAAGFLARTGGRDEAPAQAGISHFLEHMCFKGTATRSSQQLSLEFDALGGHPNAFTSQDRTFFYGVTRSADVDAQIELLADMMQSSLPPGEFEMEKKVVLEEIAMSRDSIEHVAFDFILERVFPGHPLSWPVLGYEETVRNLTRDEMYDYFRSHYAPDNLVLIVAGSARPEAVIASAQRHCGRWGPRKLRHHREPPAIQTGSAVRHVERFNQQLIAISFAAPDATDPLHETARAVASILGGDNSRFYWNIMQVGLSSRAGAWRLDFSDCGLLILSGMCDPDKIEPLCEAMRRQAAEMCRPGSIEPREIDRVKNRRRTALAVEGESPYYRLVQVMDDVDTYGRPRTVEERLAAVDAVTEESIADCFARYPIDGPGFLTSVGPRDWPNSSAECGMRNAE